MSPHHPRKALFSEGNVPPGGTCLSTFVVAASGKKILVGKMAKPEVWVERFFVGPKFVESYVGSGKFILPARHIAWYESPHDAASNILKEMVGLKIPKSRISLVDLQSHVRGEIDSKENPAHWDLCFVYRVDLSTAEAKKLKRPLWFGTLEFRPSSGLKVDDFARGHGDVLEQAKLIKGAI